MLWHKAWLETRSRFFAGLAIITLMACGAVFTYPKVQSLMPQLSTVDPGTALGRTILEAAQLSRDYRGFIWSQWYRENLPEVWTIFAVLLAAGSPLAPGTKGSIFTLTLPVSRADVLWTRAAVGLTQLFAIALLPAFVIVLASPGVGQRYALTDVAVHTLCLFAGGTVFYGLSFLLSAMLDDLWRPLLGALAIAVALALTELLWSGAETLGLYRVMSGELYFRSGTLPWMGLTVSVGLALTMLYTATRIAAQRDY